MDTWGNCDFCPSPKNTDGLEMMNRRGKKNPGKRRGKFCSGKQWHPKTKRKYLLWETEGIVFNEMAFIEDLPAGGCEMQWLAWHRGGDRASRWHSWKHKQREHSQGSVPSLEMGPFPLDMKKKKKMFSIPAGLSRARGVWNRGWARFRE